MRGFLSTFNYYVSSYPSRIWLLWKFRRRLRKKELSLLHTIGDDESQLKGKQLKRLKQIRELKNIYGFELSRQFRFPLLILTFLVIFFFAVQDSGSTKISARLKLSGIQLKTPGVVTLSSNRNDHVMYNLSNGKITFNGLIAGTEYSGETIHDIIPSGNSHQVVKSLSIPRQSTIELIQPLPRSLTMTISSDRDTLSGKLHVDNAILFSDGTPTDTLTGRNADEYPRPYQLDFIKDFSNHTTFTLTAEGVDHFGFPPMNVTEIAFLNKFTNERIKSSVLGGSIHLLETGQDSIVLRPGDSLRMDFTNTLAQIYIRSEGSYLDVQFDADVSVLHAGPAIFEDAELLNRMPSRIAIGYNKHPYLWALLLSLIPIIFVLVYPKRKT